MKNKNHFKPSKPKRLYLWKEFPNEENFPLSYDEYLKRAGIKKEKYVDVKI